jgi:hypothetical protein
MLKALLCKNSYCKIQRSENQMIYRQMWQNLLRKAMAQKWLFANDDDDFIYAAWRFFLNKNLMIQFHFLSV